MPTTTRTYGPWQLFKTIKGVSTLQGSYPTIDQCEAAAVAAGISFTYVMRQACDLRVVVTAAPSYDSAGTNYPLVFNYSSSAKPGDVVSLQGENFGTNPKVLMNGSTTLEIVNRYGTVWLAAQIPTTAAGPIIVQIQNETGTSAAVKLNQAQPLNMDATQLVPGGAFKIAGRNLVLPGTTPSVIIGGYPAKIDLTKSDENLLVCILNTSNPASPNPTVTVDNGNGTGAVTFTRPVEVVSGSGDPFGLSVGWGAAFTPIAANIIDLTGKVVTDGNTDNASVLSDAVWRAGQGGGGVVKLPAGKIKTSGSMNLPARVVLAGAGKDQTEILYSANYAIYAQGMDLVGVRNLTMTNTGAQEGPLMKQGSRSFIQNVRFNLGTSRQMYLDGNRNFVVQGSDFNLGSNMNYQGPYVIGNSVGLSFTGNTTTWPDGAPAFGRTRDSFIQGNTFSRDAKTQANPQGVFHAMTIDFTHHLAVLGNTFNVVGGPITNKTRNDGETILTEGGGVSRTENLGTVTGATSTTFSDTSNSFNWDPFGDGVFPNFGVSIVAGKGTGQTRSIISASGTTMTIDHPWDSIPDNSSKYTIGVWGIEKSIIKGNNLSQNPRGIWIYHSCVRELDILNNSISEGGGIYLRSFQNLSTKSFMPIYNVLVKSNTIINTTGNWMSYINNVFVNSDAKNFGIATIGVEMRSNKITANIPNVGSQYEEYAQGEGYVNMMRIENYNGVEISPIPRLLGTIIEDDTAINATNSVTLGTGAGYTTVVNVMGNSGAWTDWATTGGSEKSTGTIVK